MGWEGEWVQGQRSASCSLGSPLTQQKRKLTLISFTILRAANLLLCVVNRLDEEAKAARTISPAIAKRVKRAGPVARSVLRVNLGESKICAVCVVTARSKRAKLVE